MFCSSVGQVHSPPGDAGAPGGRPPDGIDDGATLFKIGAKHQPGEMAGAG